MYGFRDLLQNRVVMGVALTVLVVVLGLGTYVLMYQPSAGVTIQVGSATRPDDAGAAAPSPSRTEASPSASPRTNQLSVSPTMPPRSAVSMKVQTAGGSAQQADEILRRAQQLGYPAAAADVQGKAVSGVIIRHRPGKAPEALRAASELAPGAALEEHSDISVDVVIAVGKT